MCLPQPRRCYYLLQENCHFLFVAGARIQTHGPCTCRKKLHLQTNCKSRLEVRKVAGGERNMRFLQTKSRYTIIIWIIWIRSNLWIPTVHPCNTPAFLRIMETTFTLWPPALQGEHVQSTCRSDLLYLTCIGPRSPFGAFLKQILHGYPCDTSHLHIAEETVLIVEEPHGKAWSASALRMNFLP